MGKVNAAVATTDVDYSKYFKAENKEAEGFQKKLQDEFGLRLPTHTTTTVEDSNHNGIYGDLGDDKNFNGKKDRGEKATGDKKSFVQADKPAAQYTVFELHKKTLSDHPDIVNFLKSNGYAVYDIKRDGEGKPVKFLFVKSDQVAALRNDLKSDRKARGVEDEGPRYAQAKPAPADKGTTSSGSGVHGEHPVNKHMKKQPIAKREESPNLAKNDKPDSKRQPGTTQPVKNANVDNDTWGVKKMSFEQLAPANSGDINVTVGGHKYVIRRNPENHRVKAKMKDDPYVIRSSDDRRFTEAADRKARASGNYRIVVLSNDATTHYYFTDEQFKQRSVKSLLGQGVLRDITDGQ